MTAILTLLAAVLGAFAIGMVAASFVPEAVSYVGRRQAGRLTLQSC
jgi:hypothetical protein